MSEDSKVISLAGRVRTKAAKTAAGTPPHARPDEPASRPAADPPSARALPPVSGSLVWLYCPTCNTLEYTEQHVPGGRTHNACGTQVQEAPVELDLRAEYTLAEFNLRHLERLAQVLEVQGQRFREYQQRLKFAAGAALAPYPLTDETLKRLPVATVDPLGLFMSPFLHEPARRFAEARLQASGATQDTVPGEPEHTD